WTGRIYVWKCMRDVLMGGMEAITCTHTSLVWMHISVYTGIARKETVVRTDENENYMEHKGQGVNFLNSHDTLGMPSIVLGHYQFLQDKGLSCAQDELMPRASKGKKTGEKIMSR
ncbi:Hypothetical predicted protein, partial [Marmota monax]